MYAAPEALLSRPPNKRLNEQAIQLRDNEVTIFKNKIQSSRQLFSRQSIHKRQLLLNGILAASSGQIPQLRLKLGSLIQR